MARAGLEFFLVPWAYLLFYPFVSLLWVSPQCEMFLQDHKLFPTLPPAILGH